MGSVYVVSEGGKSKVGMSTNPRKRVKDVSRRMGFLNPEIYKH